MNVKAGGIKMNYWKQFAEMLGLELEQEFYLTDFDVNRKDKLTYKITEFGLLCKSKMNNDWLTVSLITLKKIINGDVKAVPKPWKPKKGETYWYYPNPIYFGVINSYVWDDDLTDLLFWKVGNCFKTEEEAKTKGKEIMEQIQKEYEEA